MIIRGAGVKYAKALDELMTKHDYQIKPKHLVTSLVAEDNKDEIIAFGTLNTIIEASILVDETKSRYARAKALKMLLDQAAFQATQNGYDHYHVFATNSNIEQILLAQNFKRVNGTVLVKWT